MLLDDRPRRPAALLAAALLIGLAALNAPPPALAQCGGAIVIDGNLADWACQPALSDPPDDCRRGDVDLTSFGFAADQGQPNLSFLLRRAESASGSSTFSILVDTNNDGDYEGAHDRRIIVQYRPRSSDSLVDVTVERGDRSGVVSQVNNADWGASLAEGGDGVELLVSTADLGIGVGQAIQLQALGHNGSSPNSAACDRSDEVQWSPADGLGLWLVVALVGSAGALMAWRRGRLERHR